MGNSHCPVDIVLVFWTSILLVVTSRNRLLGGGSSFVVASPVSKTQHLLQEHCMYLDPAPELPECYALLMGLNFIHFPLEQVTSLVEILCLLVFFGRLTHFAKVTPRIVFWKDTKNICIMITILVGFHFLFS